MTTEKPLSEKRIQGCEDVPDWFRVKDVAEAVDRLKERGKIGEPNYVLSEEDFEEIIGDLK